MSEQTMWRRVQSALRGLDPVRVENPAGPGTPDVNYIDGWLELKWARTWPSGAETPLRLPHYTTLQRRWHLRRAALGGRVHVLLKVSSDWLLLWGPDAARHLGYLPRRQLLAMALLHCPKGLNETELRKCLTSPPPPATGCLSPEETAYASSDDD